MNILFPTARQPLHTRPISMPDGRTHMVTLQAGYWESLDWMIEVKGQSLEKITGFCWRHLEECPNDPLNGVLEYYIHCFMQDEHAKEKNLANDNYWSK
jgi:hypothetical protein